MTKPLWVPQYGDKVIAFEQLAYKAGTGSYKACDYLLSALQFVSIAALGPEAFDTLSVSELQKALSQAYLDACQPQENKDAIALAVRWAWPPMNNYWIVFDALELTQAVNGLCALLQRIPQDKALQHLLAACAKDPDSDYFELGQSLRSMGFLREVLQEHVAKYPLLLQGFDSE